MFLLFRAFFISCGIKDLFHDIVLHFLYILHSKQLIKFLISSQMNTTISFSNDKSEVMKDSPIDVAIIFALDMVGLIAQHCVTLMEDYGMSCQHLLSY